nr:atp-dependent rna helicase suv3, mitochondrial [Quercus suber]
MIKSCKSNHHDITPCLTVAVCAKRSPWWHPVMSHLSFRNNARCIYCAFRTQQLALQARRQRSSSSQGDFVDRLFPGLSVKDTSPTPSARTTIKRTDRGRRLGGKATSQSKDHDGDRGGQLVRAAQSANEFTFRKHTAGASRLISGKGGRLYKSMGVGGNNSYEDVLRLRLQTLRDELKEIPLLEQIRKEQEELGEQSTPFETVWDQFVRLVTGAAAKSSDKWAGEHDGNAKIKQDLRDEFYERGQSALDSRIKYHFYGHLTSARFDASEIENQKALADLRYPTEWYPATRSQPRIIHLHVGPTNSGKTYHALQALEKAKSGVYAGPLRLLAHEVYTRMNAKGRACYLITGEERRLPEIEMDEDQDSVLSSCTVEMVPINKRFDVAVIDEIQMIGSPERGWAWTQALLGVIAKEVHLCGELRTVPLIQQLAASLGEELIIHRYERLSPLEVAHESLNGDLSKLRKGDCIVSFSIMGIHALRKQIEQRTGKKVATVYGSLPPETRAQQARLFNDPDNDYDYLVASDAVGMGLNLAIKRMIFEASSKFDGITTRPLAIADIKQIAGRAGRYRTAAQVTETPTSSQALATVKGDQPTTSIEREGRENVGIVTTLENFDLPIVATAMSTEPEPIRTAGIFPPSAILERFAAYFPPGTPFSYIVTRLHELSQMHTRFHLCGLKDQVWVADMIEAVPGLSITDRAIISAAPASKSDTSMWKTLMPALASCIAEQKTCNIADLTEMPLEILEAEVSAKRTYLQELERLHKALVTYLWLSYRFAGVFNTRALAFYAKALTEEKIEKALRAFSFSEAARKRLAKERQQRQQMLFSDMQNAMAQETGAPEQDEETTTLPQDEPDSAAVSAAANTAAAAESTANDHFSTEPDDVIFDEPEQAEVDQEAPATEPSTSFAQWRAQPGNTLSASDIDTKLSDAAARASEPPQAPPPRPVFNSSPAPADNNDDDVTPRSSEHAYGANVPPKHLAHLDADATEAERNIAARP